MPEELKIQYAMVKDVKVRLQGDALVSVMITFWCALNTEYVWETLLPSNNWHIRKLSNYTDSGDSDVYALKGKAVRIFTWNNFFRGFAHPVEDKFIPVYWCERKEVDESRLEKLLQSR